MTKTKRGLIAGVAALMLMIVVLPSASAAPSQGSVSLYALGFIRARLQVELGSDDKLQAYMFHAGGEIYNPSWTAVHLCHLMYAGGPCVSNGVGAGYDAGNYQLWAGPARPDGTAHIGWTRAVCRPWRAAGTIRIPGPGYGEVHDYQVTLSSNGTRADCNADWYTNAIRVS